MPSAGDADDLVDLAVVVDRSEEGVGDVGTGAEVATRERLIEKHGAGAAFETSRRSPRGRGRVVFGTR